MTAYAARWALASVGLIALTGFGMIVREFDTTEPLFFLGLTLIIVATVGTNGVLREVRTRTLNDEFEAGYRVGYRAGRRAPVSLARPTVNNKPTPLRPKRTQKTNEPSWPDSEDSPPGSTKLR